jgi:arginase
VAEILALDLTTVRHIGLERAAQAALDRLTRPEIEGFFIHLDADCLDDRIMPAVDYRLPDGFSGGDVVSLLRMALASGQAVGLEVTIYNPALDEDGRAGRELTNVLAAALGRSAR